MQGFDGCGSGAIVPRLKSYGRGVQSIICRALRDPQDACLQLNLSVRRSKQTKTEQKALILSTATSKKTPRGHRSRQKQSKNP